MELRKTSENVSRTFDAEGNVQERVEHISYEVCDKDGNVVGSAYVNGSEAGMNISIYGSSTVEEGDNRLKELLGISE